MKKTTATSTALYIHYPWCLKKCPYCDFNSHESGKENDQEAFLDALLEDFFEQGLQEREFASIFIGGGTPSLFPPKLISKLLAQVKTNATAEITIEVNPGSTEHFSFTELKKAGINRVSIGAQSFDDSMLKSIGRLHTGREIITCYQQARSSRIENINLDLMWGLPEQTTSQAIQDLELAIDLEPDHISWYQLTIEPNTIFSSSKPRLPDEYTQCSIETSGSGVLKKAGYERYEVSAFAKAGKACLHNQNYWNFGDYFGVGPGAHGKLTKIEESGVRIFRTKKLKQPAAYIKNPTHTIVKEVSNSDYIAEFLMNALRLQNGVDWSTFEEKTGLVFEDIRSEWRKLTEKGLVEPRRCKTTELGYRHLDSVLQTFV
jgi:putative oxygen-independent coproporphyrinogen III oxidase